MASALAYQLGHGTLGVPVAFPTRTGPRCGHYEQVTTPSGKQGFRFLRDPNAVCGLPSKKVNVEACATNPAACRNAPMPAGWTQVGSQPVTGFTPSERIGGALIDRAGRNIGSGQAVIQPNLFGGA